MTNTSGLTLILPAYNEESGISQTLLEIDRTWDSQVPLIVFVSEDGSSDKTREIVETTSLAVKNCTIQLSSRSGRLGYSKAVQRGILECRTQYIAFMDSDGQFDPKEIAKLFHSISTNCVVVGFRNPRVDSLLRKAYSMAFRIAYRLVGGPKLKDPSSPFILANTDEIAFLGTVPIHLDFGYWWEFQTRIAAQGLRVIQVPVTHRNRISGKTQVYKFSRVPRIVASHLKGLLALRKEIKASKYDRH